MQLDPHLSRIHEQLVAAAALGDDRTREIVDALATASAPAVRLALLAAASEIADEITAALLDHPGSPAIAIRIDGNEVAVDVRAIATADDAARANRAGEELNARISLRLTDSLKADIDAAAERDGVSVNTWLAHAADCALRPSALNAWQSKASQDRPSDHQHVTGWING